MARLDLTDQPFGRLVAREPAGVNARRVVLWRCECECGNTAVLPADRLVRGGVRSCGCGHREAVTGERHHSARLTAETVRLARRLADEGFTLSEINDHLPVRVDKATLSLAINRRTWKEVE